MFIFLSCFMLIMSGAIILLRGIHGGAFPLVLLGLPVPNPTKDVANPLQQDKLVHEKRHMVLQRKQKLNSGDKAIDTMAICCRKKGIHTHTQRERGGRDRLG